MAKSNADRQREYRERKRNGRNAAAPPICAVTTDVTRDRIMPNGDQLIYLGDWGFGPQYARVVNAMGKVAAAAAAERSA